MKFKVGDVVLVEKSNFKHLYPDKTVGKITAVNIHGVWVLPEGVEPSTHPTDANGGWAQSFNSVQHTTKLSRALL